MNIYPSWWNTPITVYNKFEDPQTNIIQWYRKQLDGAFWKNVGQKVNIGDTVLETNSIICRIRKSDLFKEKYEWDELANDIKSDFFTLGVGDIIIRGNIVNEIDEYTKGQRSSDLIARYKALQGCIQIERVSINVDGGRGQEHYLAEGI